MRRFLAPNITPVDHGLGVNTWERERGRLHRAGVIRKDQPGKDGEPGRGEVVWSLVVSSHGTPLGANPGGWRSSRPPPSP